MSIRTSVLVSLALLGLSGMSGCSDDFFGLGGDDEVGDTTDTGEPELLEGIRVHPRYLLVDVSAVVTIEAQGGDAPTGCPPATDGEGGYLCDTLALVASTVVVRVERDGFEPIAHEQNRPQGYVDTLEVELVPVGGPLGTWSDCVLRDAFANCDEVCGAQSLTCLPTSCASDDPDVPIATVLGFEGSACVEPASRVEAQACASGPPAAFTDSLRCCCAG